MQKELAYNYSNLLGKLRAMGITQEELAKKICISPTTLNMKLNNKGEFTQSEMKAICNVISEPVDNVTDYFFTMWLWFSKVL